MLRSITGPANLAFHRFLFHSEINVRTVFFESLKKDISYRYSAKMSQVLIINCYVSIRPLVKTVGYYLRIFQPAKLTAHLQRIHGNKRNSKRTFYSTFLIQLRGRLDPNVISLSKVDFTPTAVLLR